MAETVRIKEKNEFGEVFTPPFLICDMLNKLPEHVWSDPNLKWLDPANGVGNFPIFIVEKLMIGLATHIPNEVDRKQHILTNMLYMIELNSENVEKSRQHFGVSANICHASFFDFEKWKQEFDNVSKFDIIVGNPPYSKYTSSDNKRGGGYPLWKDFVLESLNLLHSNGYLCYVHPAAWRKPKAVHDKWNLYDLMCHENQILYLEMHTALDGYKNFLVGTRYDWYVLCKRKPSQNTVVIDDLGNKSMIDLRKWPFLPNCRLGLVGQLLANEQDARCEIIFSRSLYGTDKLALFNNVRGEATKQRIVHDNKSEQAQYPLIAATNKRGVKYKYVRAIDPWLEQREMYQRKIRVKKRVVSKPPNFVPMFGVSKVIFGDNVLYAKENARMYNIVIDLDGKYGMTQHAMAVPVKNREEAQMIKSVLESKIWGDFLKAVLFSNYQLDYRIFKYLKNDFWKQLMLQQS